MELFHTMYSQPYPKIFSIAVKSLFNYSQPHKYNLQVGLISN